MYNRIDFEASSVLTHEVSTSSTCAKNRHWFRLHTDNMQQLTNVEMEEIPILSQDSPLSLKTSQKGKTIVVTDREPFRPGPSLVLVQGYAWRGDKDYC
ncbi:hypothetical protein AVEN_101373-1 [Araneus ventricosus]|uniref:Uncharacterized protein n=1 Tax=Araneus ventricosus TaxID=182803 RepID=A0A4Y2V7I0_ARAVE|nr:hypothetical protein AVEN_101373-1 [Araneus ventricosus]